MMSLFPSFFKKTPSIQMRAVAHVFTADNELAQLVAPHMNFEDEAIEWKKVFKCLVKPGHRTAALIAYSVWTDRVRSKSNPFEEAPRMDESLRRACIEAIAMRWGLLGQ